MGEMMERLSDALDYQVIAAQTAWQRQKEKTKEILTSEAGAVDIVVILLLVVVAIVLVAIFRDQLGDLIEQVFTKLGNSVSNASDDLNGHYGSSSK